MVGYLLDLILELFSKQMIPWFYDFMILLYIHNTNCKVMAFMIFLHVYVWIHV